MLEIPEVTDGEIAFGTAKALPVYDSLPEEFQRHNGTKWNELVSAMFFCGLREIDATPKEGVDEEKAWRAIRAHLGSWEPKHEHKEAGVAYMMSQWFEDDITWKAGKLK